MSATRPPPSDAPRTGSPPLALQAWFKALSGPRAMLGVAVALIAGAGALAAWLLPNFESTGRWAAPLAAIVATATALLPLVLLYAKLVHDLERGRRQARISGAVDPVTGAASRSQFMGLVEREFSRSRRYGVGAAVLLVDVDRFRRLLEGRDEAAGDAVLREIARSALATLRGADALARFGNAQLAIFLAQADPLGALDVAERVRERVEHLEVHWRDQRLRVTVSVGVAMMRPAHLSLQAVVDDAETALGAARHAGGNCVRAAPVDPRRSPSLGPSVGDNQAAGPQV